MARKGKNKTGPRNRDGSARVRAPFTVASISQGNRDKQTSAVSARVALTQLREQGFIVVTLRASELAGINRQQRDAMMWLRSEYGIEHAKVSNTGYSLYLAHASLPEFIQLPIKQMLTFEAVDKIKKLTGIHLVPGRDAQTREERLRFSR
ncbi:MAG: hypothetical protein KGQ41_05265 [Alphaproteobacteria bacterium]|nr:hypothetical protein [Alphaproteobacteria bacterium]